MKRAVALVRVSTAGQSVERQVIAAERWAEASGYPELEIVEECGVSGVAKNREALKRIVEDARAGKVGVLWVSELSRLGRSMVAVVTLLTELDALGVRLVVANAGLDFGTPAGRLQAALLAAVSEFERALIVERTLDGLRKLKDADGKWLPHVKIGSRPLRWCGVSDGVLRDLRAKGMSMRAIAATGDVRVWREELDKERGLWSERAVKVGKSAIAHRCLVLGI